MASTGVITQRIDFIASLEHTRVPLLYLYGEKSKYRAVAEMNAQRFEQQNPDMEMIAFQEGIHDLHLQYPEAVARILVRFLEATTNVDAFADALAARETGEGVRPSRHLAVSRQRERSAVTPIGPSGKRGIPDPAGLPGGSGHAGAGLLFSLSPPQPAGPGSLHAGRGDC